MARKIPIGEATELGLEVPDTSKLAAGLRGPNDVTQPLGNAGPQVNRAAFQGPPATPGVRAGAAANAAVGDAVAAAKAAAAAAPPSIPEALAAEKRAGLLDRNLGSVRGAAGSVAKSLTSGVGRVAIPIGLASEAANTALTGTDEFSKRTGVESDGSVMGDIGVRALGTLQNIGNAATFGVADRVGNMIAGNGFIRSPSLADPPTPTAAQPTAQPAAPVAPTPAAAQPNGPFEFNTPTLGGGAPSAPAADPNVVTRNGNSFSGTNIREGFSYAGGGKPSGFGVTTVPGSSFGGGAPSAPVGPDPYGPGANGGVVGIRSGVEDRNARFDREVEKGRLESAMRNGKYSRERIAAMNAYAGLAGEPVNPMDPAKASLQAAGMREAGDMNRARMADATQRRSNDQNNETLRRGQDGEIEERRLMLGAAGAKAKSDAAKDAQDQANKDRQYQLDVAKFGVDQANTMQSQRSAREGQVQKNLESIFTGSDNEVDKAAAGEARRALDRSVARLGGNGMQDLSPLDEQRLLAGTQLLKTMKANSGILPWKPDALKTIDPVDLIGMKVLPNGDRQIARGDSKAKGQVIPARFFQTEEGVRFFGGTPTNRYDMLSEGR
jgi:hypothetical protein